MKKLSMRQIETLMPNINNNKLINYRKLKLDQVLHIMLVLIQVEDTNNILMATEELEVFTEDVAEVDLLMVVAI